MTTYTEICCSRIVPLLCVYLPHCILEPSQCNIDVSNKRRISWLNVDIENNKNGDCARSLQEKSTRARSNIVFSLSAKGTGELH